MAGCGIAMVKYERSAAKYCLCDPNSAAVSLIDAALAAEG